MALTIVLLVKCCLHFENCPNQKPDGRNHWAQPFKLLDGGGGTPQQVGALTGKSTWPYTWVVPQKQDAQRSLGLRPWNQNVYHYKKYLLNYAPIFKCK